MKVEIETIDNGWLLHLSPMVSKKTLFIERTLFFKTFEEALASVTERYSIIRKENEES